LLRARQQHQQQRSVNGDRICLWEHRFSTPPPSNSTPLTNRQKSDVEVNVGKRAAGGGGRRRGVVVNTPSELGEPHLYVDILSLSLLAAAPS